MKELEMKYQIAKYLNLACDVENIMATCTLPLYFNLMSRVVSAMELSLALENLVNEKPAQFCQRLKLSRSPSM